MTTIQQHNANGGPPRFILLRGVDGDIGLPRRTRRPGTPAEVTAPVRGG
jgi:hypothetical protein